MDDFSPSIRIDKIQTEHFPSVVSTKPFLVSQSRWSSRARNVNRTRLHPLPWTWYPTVNVIIRRNP